MQDVSYPLITDCVRLVQVVSYKDLYGWTMDEIVAQVGTRNNCTFCGVFRRQALDRGAQLIKADKVWGYIIRSTRAVMEL